MSIEFKATPPAKPQPEPSTETGIRTTNIPTIKNGVLIAEGAGARGFSNTILIGLLLGIPYYFKRKIGGGFVTFVILAALFAIPILMAYWSITSTYLPRINEKCKLPGKGVEHYLEFHDPELAQKYRGNNKIPYETFYELYFENKVSFKGDALDVLEMRHDWASFRFTLGLYKFFLFGMIPEVIMHSRSQDEEQVREHYDRGDDFYEWFLGPRMIYTSGIVSDITREETLEELQDNKLRVVAEKIGVKKGDRVLDLGCGWGTLARFLSSQYGAHVTGVTLGRNQAAWGNANLAKDGIPTSQSKILCMDYRDAPVPEGKYNCITCLEMSEHVGVRKFNSFLQQVYDMLDDDGVFFMQYAGLRKSWQFEDLIWGLFMNKYIFPGADASTPLGWTIDKLEATGFEITSVDTIGIHYSATIWRWYRNWLGNKDSVINKYGLKWFRIWEFFLASSTIVAREGSSTAFQIVMRKNLNSTHRAEFIPRQFNLQVPKPANGNKWLKEDF
ncbi:Sphingolipid C9-methyltransferase 2 [Wickerhamiella sorbophila]|uniref:sphingolipid C(9)-methyltransferase n=1 Tax=Wickerhamiella sorbophila TaxID=45607 RepID=A0A2T0FPS5_9ASCO|nr:Sphingolipid C9-methyltransferase 2 [Wickerhamiella sorbophila]PRT56994.1 Sphingolipid C9-methyltransferase 2 [Wickerhamiella sorbophila]